MKPLYNNALEAVSKLRETSPPRPPEPPKPRKMGIKSSPNAAKTPPGPLDREFRNRLLGAIRPAAIRQIVVLSESNDVLNSRFFPM